MKAVTVPTSPIGGQKTGTSGLRKRVSEFQSPHYLQNWVQSLFHSLSPELKGTTLVVGGDGRYFNAEAIQIIVKMAAANRVGKLLVGQNGILATPAVSSIIRAKKCFGGIILTASHNPGGPNADFGIKFNSSNGGPASEAVTDKIFHFTESIDSYLITEMEDVDLSKLGIHRVSEEFEVEIIDSLSCYKPLLQSIFDFNSISQLLKRADFRAAIDCLHGVTGPYATQLFTELGLPLSTIFHGENLPDFGGLHPDPNLTYAADLVEKMNTGNFDFGVAFDGDGDRNMILGNKFFVSPSDSVAILAENACLCIPYFKHNNLSAVARSMPTSAALDRVAKRHGIPIFEVPTGWKYFGNIMDHYELTTPGVLCGEESFGTGSDHIREKDGIWAALAWLSILAYRNKDTPAGSLVTVEQIVKEHWKEYGRNYYSRYDYEEVESEKANLLMATLEKRIASSQQGDDFGSGFSLDFADNFEYKDQFDGSVAKNQGVRFVFSDGSRFVVRLSGTGSVGATIRVYLEKYVPGDADHSLDTQVALKSLAEVMLEVTDITDITGRSSPTVIT